jgi:hypothetical protein
MGWDPSGFGQGVRWCAAKLKQAKLKQASQPPDWTFCATGPILPA